MTSCQPSGWTRSPQGDPEVGKTVFCRHKNMENISIRQTVEINRLIEFHLVVKVRAGLGAALGLDLQTFEDVVAQPEKVLAGDEGATVTQVELGGEVLADGEE